MANVLAFRRSTSQPSTINTVSGVVANVGTALTGTQTTSSFPARCVNLETTFDGNTYALKLTALNTIQIHKYDGTTWSLVAGPFAPPALHSFIPLCIHVVNNVIVALWTDVAAAGDGIRGARSFDGTVWTALTNGTTPVFSSLGGHSVVYRSAIWFATAAGLWAIAPLHRTITLAAPPGTPFVVGELITGGLSNTTAIVRATSGATLKVDTIVGGTGEFTIGETLIGATSGVHLELVTVSTLYVNSAPDTGNDAGLTGVTGPSNLIGCFASWDGSLYFLQPKTTAGATKIYSLNSSWSTIANLPAPQWTNTAYTGVPDVGFASVTNDGGMSSLFVNKLDRLCILFSGATSTKLAVATSKALPLQFTDVTTSILSSGLAAKANLGINLYDDDRRRANNLQWLLIRDLATASTYICPWDGTSTINIAFTVSGVDYMLPASRHGEEATFTNLSPSVRITSVSQPFPGRVRIDYKVRCSPAHPVDVTGEYTIDGDIFFPMSEGDGDSGSAGLTTSPSGNNYFFHWDAWVELTGDLENVGVRILARISGL